ncbi:MAG: MFS transporter [Tepidisphaeraceae bacterium]|jgi:MFS family permease
MSTVCENPPGGVAAPAMSRPLRKLDRRAVTAALMLVMVLASMEQTVTSTAMPTIIGSLHGLEHYSWVASIYLLACTVSMPLYGRLADALGRKRVILFAIGLFVLASLMASTARSMPQLILYRGLMGLGAGGIMPVVLTILGDIFTIEERARVQGFFSAVWGTSALAGPALGWFLVATLGWRAVFFVNLPFGLIGWIVLWRFYHDQEKPHAVGLDLPGFAALAIGFGTLLTLVSRVGPGGWALPTAVSLGATTLIAFVFYALHERGARDPILPLDLLLDRAIGPSLIGSGLLGIGFLSLDTFVPLYVQGGRGGGVGAAASVVSPVMLTWALSGIFAAPLVVKWGFRRTSWLGSSLIIVGFSGLIACAILGSSRTVLACVLAITGFGFGPSSMGYLLAAQNAVPWQRRGIVTGSIHFCRTAGGALGIGILGALFNIITGPKLRGLQAGGISPAALLDPHAREQLPPAVIQSAGQTIAGALHWVFGVMLAVAVMQFIVTCWMPRRKADHRPTTLEAAEAIVG